MSAPLELLGERFGKLLVVAQAPNRNGKTYWVCRCDCGQVKEIHGVNLKRGNTTTCGCGIFRFPSKHGLHRSPEYQAWADMLHRCRNRRDPQWHLYGGRGITVCDAWVTFENFYRDMGPRPVGHSLDRRDNNGNYEPGNCRWATPRDQANNTRSNHLITFNGETRSVSAWAQRTGLGVPTIFTRLRLGWTVDEVLTTPKARHQIDITYRGKKYSLTELAHKSGQTPQTVQNRLKRGLTLEQALNEPTKRLIEFKGKRRSSLDWSKATGIPKRVINARLAVGWSVARTLTEPVVSRASKKVKEHR